LELLEAVAALLLLGQRGGGARPSAPQALLLLVRRQPQLVDGVHGGAARSGTSCIL
jgi:hypothetical protein